MSLFGSLTTAISGLNSQQDALSNVSNNIANSQTVGYKRVDTSFDELVTDSSKDYNAPGGVIANPVYVNSVAGSISQTQTATNMAISGSGFFQVKAPPTTNAGVSSFSSADLYTRRGDFQLNKDGYLVNGAGYYLEGNSVNPLTKATTSSTESPIQISKLSTKPVASTTVALAANLPASSQAKTIGGVANGNYTAPSPVTVQVYDAQGTAHTMTVQFNKVGPDTTATPAINDDTWTADISATGLGQTTDVPYQLTMKFSSGASGQPPAGTLMSMTNTTPTATGTQTNPTGTVTVPSSQGTGANAVAGITFVTGSGTNAVSQTLNLNVGNFGAATGITQYAGNAIDVSSLQQDGIPAGSYQSVSIDQNGYVSVNYDNGTSQSLYQVQLAQFNAPQDLQKVDGSAFEATTSSGTAKLSQAGTSGAGSIQSSATEASNVDIATEFTKMIEAQQAYSANSKVITTTDSLLQQIIQLVQG